MKNKHREKMDPILIQITIYRTNNIFLIDDFGYQQNVHFN
jgi:hypothetical protein